MELLDLLRDAPAADAAGAAAADGRGAAADARAADVACRRRRDRHGVTLLPIGIRLDACKGTNKNGNGNDNDNDNGTVNFYENLTHGDSTRGTRAEWLQVAPSGDGDGGAYARSRPFVRRRAPSRSVLAGAVAAGGGGG